MVRLWRSLVLVILLAAFLATYATGPAGKADLAARALRLNFPTARALPTH